MKEIRNFYAQPIRLILSLTPCLVFILTVTLMTGVSELTSEPEIIFPEAAAIALGAIISPRLPWKVNKLSALILVFICAVAAVGIFCLCPAREVQYVYRRILQSRESVRYIQRPGQE